MSTVDAHGGTWGRVVRSAALVAALAGCGEGVADAPPPPQNEPVQPPSQSEPAATPQSPAPVVDVPVADVPVADVPEDPAVDPTPAMGELSVTTVPSGATVSLNGESVGISPVDSLQVAPGTHVVTLALPQHGTRDVELEIPAGASRSLKQVRLEPWGTLDPRSLSIDVKAWHGEDPLTEPLRVSPNEEHVIYLRRDGYAMQRLTLEVPLAAKVVIRPQDWAGFQSRLDVSAFPEEVVVYAGGKRLQPNDGVATLAREGTVDVVFQRRGFESQRISVELVLGKVVPVECGKWVELSSPSVTVLFCLDRSGSMAGAKLLAAKTAVLAAAKQLDAGDRIGVLAFSDRYAWISPLLAAEELATLRRRLGGLRADGGTDLFPALEQAYEVLADDTSPIRHVIVISDGATKPAVFKNVVESGTSAGVTLSAIAIGDEADARLLGLLASWGKGRLYIASDIRRLPEVTQLISRKLKTPRED